MSAQRASYILSLYVTCTGLPFAFDKGWGYSHAEGITPREDFTILTILQTMPDHTSYYGVLNSIAERS